MTTIKKLILAGVILFVVLFGFYLLLHWGFERAHVGPDEALMVIKKFGDPLPADRIVVPADDTRYKGVLQELKGPGRYFLNPLMYDWKVVKLTEIATTCANRAAEAGDEESEDEDENGRARGSSEMEEEEEGSRETAGVRG